MFVNPATGLVALKYLGAPDPESNDPNNPDRQGHAGAGLVAGEVRGFNPKTAEWLVKQGWAEEVPQEIVQAAIEADATDRADAQAAKDMAEKLAANMATALSGVANRKGK